MKKNFISAYHSPLGKILLAADEIGLIGLWFEGAKYYAKGLAPKYEEREVPVFCEAKRWLDFYFSGKEPPFLPPIHLLGTSFQKEVWEILHTIPYGTTLTYGEIAKRLSEKRGIKRMSPQAVGGAVGHNPVSIIVPCHRVVGADGSFVGYAGGLARKIRLLSYEGVNTENFRMPKNSTAP